MLNVTFLIEKHLKLFSVPNISSTGDVIYKIEWINTCLRALPKGMQILLWSASLSVLLPVVRPAPVLSWCVQVLLRGEPRRPRRREPHLTVVVMSEHHVGVVDPARHNLTPEMTSMPQIFRLHRSICHLMSVDGRGPLWAIVSQSIGEVESHSVGRVVKTTWTHLKVAMRSAVTVKVRWEWILAF